MRFNALAKKAAKGTAPLEHGGNVEVENLIRFVLEHGAEGAAEIERVCALYRWREEFQYNADGTHFAPMAPWAQACAAFGHQGVAGLLPLLEDVRSEASVAALLAFCERADFSQDDPQSPPSRALAALNSLPSFEKGVVVPVAMQQALLRLVQRAWQQAPSMRGRSLALYAARGACMPEALEWVQSLALQDDELAAARTPVLKRLKARASR